MRFYGYVALGLLLVPATFAGGITSFAPKGGSSPEIPFSFVANHGQASDDVRFVGNGPGFRAMFRADGVTVHQAAATARLTFAGGARNPRMEVAEPLGSTVNYLRGADPSKWLSGLPLYGALLYHGVWPGIDVRFRGESGNAKAEYLVAPRTSVDQIRLRFDGVPSLAADGSLVVRTESGVFSEDKPYLYQDRNGHRAEVAGAFRIHPDGTVGFVALDWDKALPLVIDPFILFSGYVGGSAQTNITAMVENSYYNTVVAGWTLSTELTATGGAQAATAGGVDAFVATFSPAGGTMLSCTYLGGSGDDRAFGLAVDSANYIYVTGWTMSRNFPVAHAIQTKLSGSRDAFVAKLNPTATAFVFSTYLGGTGVDSGNGIRLASGNAPVIVGDTTSANLPSTTGSFQRTLGGTQDVFVAKLTPAGTAISMLTYYGGTANEHGAGVALDATDQIAIVGSTFSGNLPVRNAFQARSGGGQDAFVAVFVANGTSLVFSTYLGGSAGSAGAPEQANCVNFAATGRLMVAGTTASTNFPVTTDAAQLTFAGGATDGFIANLNANGTLRRSTYLGGSGDDGINAMMLDPYGSGPVVGGYTTSTDFPTKNPVQSANAGGMDGFLARSSFSSITHATYIGGSSNDSVNAIAVDSMFNLTVAGSTASTNLPVAGYMPAFQGATLGAFITKMAGSFSLAAVAPPVFYLDVWHNTGYNGPNVTLGAVTYGVSTDIPISGDWNGTGSKLLGVFRSGTWILDSNANGVLDVADKTVSFGQAGDIPVVGDWNGTGRAKLGLFRNGTFILDLSGHLSGTSTGLTDATFTFGQAGDLPVTGDWTNSGTTRVGVFRNGQWLVDFSGTHSAAVTWTFGQAGDKPVVGNWGGFGESIGVYRNGIWILDYDLSHTISTADMVFSFGGASYIPLIW